MGAAAVRRRRVGRRAPAFTQEALFDVDLRPERRYYRQMLDALARSDFGTDGLEAEVAVSRLFGTVWAGQEAPRDGGTEEAFGLGLVEYAGQHRTPVSVMLLRTVEVIAPIREVRESAATAADRLVAEGLPSPQWMPGPGSLVPGRCWAYEDIFGDQTTVIAEFTRGSDPRGDDRHATVVQIEHSTFSAATNAMLVDAVDATIRDLRNDAKNSGPMFTLRQVDPAWARAVQERGFARTDLIPGIQVWPHFADVRALALARVRTLAETADALPPDPPPPTESARADLVREFLASREAHGLVDPTYAELVATAIVEYGCDYDPGNVARVSPAKWETFLFEWWPPRALPGQSFAEVVRAWSAWAAVRTTLPGMARDELAEAVTEALAQ